MATATVDVRRWSREEYESLVEQGFFHPEERIELVDGVVFEMTPQSSRHATAIRLVQVALQSCFAEEFDLRCQLPLALGVDSEPEPDLAVVEGGPRDFVAAHPGTAVLVVEVADSSLSYDRQKANLYARAGIPEHWLVNLVDWSLEISRDPRNGEYKSRSVLREGDVVSPLARPEALLNVASLLPR